MTTLAAAPPPTARSVLPLRIATRSSPLAMIQTRTFVETLRRLCPVLHATELFAEETFRTTGDRTQGRSLAEIGGKGLFAKEIHEALLEGHVDFGVHSLKDLETTLPMGITLGGVPTSRRSQGRFRDLCSAREDGLWRRVQPSAGRICRWIELCSPTSSASSRPARPSR